MELITKIHDKIAAPVALLLVLFAPVVTWATLNVMTRPEMITVAIELPNHRKPVVTMWDPIDPEVGLGGSPSWYVDYEAEAEANRYNDIPNAFYNEQSYTAEDHVCLAKNIYFEARNESMKGQMAVAIVTLNRVKDPRYPNTVCGVVYDNKQFSWYSDGLSDRPRNKKSWNDIAILASAMLAPDTTLYDYTYGSTHYHADYVAPYWKEYMVYKTTIDTHLFYYEPPKVYTASL